MATREVALCLALCGLILSTMAQTPVPETWTPVGRIAQTITGRVTFSRSEIIFQNGKSLPLARGGQMLFRPEAEEKKIMADLYKVTSPDDPVLENGPERTEADRWCLREADCSPSPLVAGDDDGRR